MALPDGKRNTYKWDGILFVGTHQRTLDEKGRLALPSAFREHLSTACMVTRVSDRPALGVWSEQEFAETIARLKANIATGENTQDDFRRFTGNADQLKIDGQGRITIPAAMRERIGVGREALVVGVWDRFEIWNADNYEQLEAAEDGTDSAGAFL